MSDPRVTPSNGRVAHVSLKGEVEAERFVEGRRLMVQQPMANITDAPRGRRVSQLLFGEVFRELETYDGFSFGQAERDGQVGYVLTGAARVAVGPDLAPFYTDDDALAEALMTAGRAQSDPLWRMPFHAPYEAMIEPGIADLDNAPKGGFAGSITAALFLRRFTQGTPRFAHFDIYGWQPDAAPARPKGGAGQAARAIFAALRQGIVS